MAFWAFLTFFQQVNRLTLGVSNYQPRSSGRPSRIWRGSNQGHMRRRVDAARPGGSSLTFSGWCKMDRCDGAAALLVESDRRNLAVQALARSATISDLATRHGVSRKFIYQQTDKARTALDDAFLSAAPEDEVLFQLTVTKTWLRQVIVGLTLICRGSYRGVVEFLRDLIGVQISVGTVHHVLQLATRQAGVVNHDQDLSGI